MGQLGSLYIDGFFLPAALVDATLFSQSVCYGPVTAIQRDVLDAQGGFAALAHTLADDTELGHVTRRAGRRIALVPVAADTVVPENRLGDLLRHELRWARTTRALRPASYAASVVTHALPVAVLLVIAAPSPGTGLLLGSVAALRAAVLALVGRRFGRAAGTAWPAPWLLMARECLYLGVWAAGFCGRTIVWRGRRLRVLTGARVAVEPESVGAVGLPSAEAQPS